MATARGEPRNPPEIRRLRYQNGTRGTRHTSLGTARDLRSRAFIPRESGATSLSWRTPSSNGFCKTRPRGTAPTPWTLNSKDQLNNASQIEGTSGRLAPLRPEGNLPFQINSPRLGPRDVAGYCLPQGTAWITRRFHWKVLPTQSKGNRPCVLMSNKNK